MLTTLRTRCHSSYRRFLNKWLYRLRDAEPGEVFLNQRRVFIVPSGAGLMFGVMLVVLFVASVNYSLNLGFALTFLIAACAVIDMYLTFRNLAHLHLAPGRVNPVFAGEEAQFELHVINRRNYERFALWLGFIGEGQNHPEQPLDIASHASRSVTLSAPSITRGRLQAPRVRLQTRFPLGLLHAWSYWQPDATALVYPLPEQNAPALPVAGDAKDDDFWRAGRAGRDDFGGIRGYQDGDAMKHLAWRQIARIPADLGGQLLTKYFEGGAASELCLDFSALPPALDTELKLSRLTRWVLEAEARGLPYAFRLGANDFAAAVGTAHRAACLQALALYEAS
ncbi:DUF58 domain-containing protein [Undibacterium arcticum]|uniref:DUF58 domain-containing protein n=1 Tax=Undibacterium arcticum TaxID=1762892 RepID=A0ABV7EWK9_9BURK